jgi:hypothetical protein
VNGAPPKVIWLRIGNASTAAIEAFIRSALVKIRTFEISPEESLLVLSWAVALRRQEPEAAQNDALQPRLGLGPRRFHRHHVSIGRGDKIRTCDPLHPSKIGSGAPEVRRAPDRYLHRILAARRQQTARCGRPGRARPPYPRLAMGDEEFVHDQLTCVRMFGIDNIIEFVVATGHGRDTEHRASTLLEPSIANSAARDIVSRARHVGMHAVLVKKASPPQGGEAYSITTPCDVSRQSQDARLRSGRGRRSARAPSPHPDTDGCTRWLRTRPSGSRRPDLRNPEYAAYH